MTTIISGSSPSITFSDGSTQTSATRPFLNRIINGAMVIDQRNAGASVTPTTNPQYLVDRWASENITTNKLSYQQNAGSVTPPVGFTNYLGITSLSAYSVSSTDYFLLQQRIEGFNTADLGWGTANAQTVTLSFWVRSSLTGTFGGNLQNEANNRFYAFSYSISSANTWEYKTVTIAGDTTGTWAKTNGTGIMLRFNLGAGSTYIGTAGAWGSSALFGVTGQVNLVGTNGATWYITGVQLEVGSTATSFDYRPYGTELALCQRYYARFNLNNSAPMVMCFSYSTTGAVASAPLPVQLRAAPSSVESGNVQITNYTGNFPITSLTIGGGEQTETSVRLLPSVASGLTANQPYMIRGSGTGTQYVALNSEL